MKKMSVRTIAYLSVLLAMEIILSRFCSFSVWNMKIGLNFVPVVVAALWFGPLSAGAVAALGDFLGAVLFPIGPYFPGFTATALLTGVVWGLFLHKNAATVRVVLAVLVNQLVLSLLLNTLWISVLYGSPYLPLLVTRLVQCAILIPVQCGVILFLRRPMGQLRKRVAR